MAASRKIATHWSLIDLGQQTGTQDIEDYCILCPPLRPLTRLSPLLSGLVPNRDHNTDLLAAVEKLRECEGPRQPVFSIFTADPFIHGKPIGRALLKKGYRRVANWPTTAQYGADFVAILQSVDLGPTRECEMLRGFAGHGLTICAVVCLPETTEHFMALQPEVLFVAPGFDLWIKGRWDIQRLLARCSTVAAVVNERAPVILMTDPNTVSLDEARRAGADGILIA